VLVLVCLLPALARAAVEGSFERTLQVSGPVDLDVVTGSGDISVQTGSGNVVKVIGYIRANGWLGDPEERVRKIEANPPIEQNGSTIRIGHLHDLELGRNVSVSYQITVPVATRLTSHTGSGDMKIEGIQGPLEGHSGSGEITISGIGSDVQVETGSGDMRLENVKGSVRAHAGSGGISATGIGGAFDGGSGSGDIRLEQTAAGDVRVMAGSGNLELRRVNGALSAKTGSGEIQVDGVPSGEWRLRAGSGNILLRVPADAAFNLDASTNSGTISLNDHPVTVQGTIGRHEVRGKVHGGGSLLEIRTGSGDVEIR
jgi:DUF4097 and DUF4098 domain-containing protein YvlB